MTISKMPDGHFSTSELEKLANKEMTGNKSVLYSGAETLGDASQNAYRMFHRTHLIDKEERIYRIEKVGYSNRGFKIHFFIDVKANELINKKEAYKVKSIAEGAQFYYDNWLKRTLISLRGI